MEEKDILKIIEDSYLDSKEFVEEDCFHHNTRYKDALLCLKYGILSAKKQNELSIKPMPNVNLYGFDMPISNVNGLDYVSIARIINESSFGDKQMYSPYLASDVDIIIDKSIRKKFNVYHSSENYCNEYLVHEGIVPTIYFKSFNVRFHDMMRALSGINKYDCIDQNKILFSNFLYLLETSKSIDFNNLDIDLCEVDNNGLIHKLDVKKLSKVK